MQLPYSHNVYGDPVLYGNEWFMKPQGGNSALYDSMMSQGMPKTSGAIATDKAVTKGSGVNPYAAAAMVAGDAPLGKGSESVGTAAQGAGLASALGGTTLGPWGALAGLVKGELIDRPAAERNAIMKAQLTRYSPWLNGAVLQHGLQQNSEYNPLAGPMQGGVQGLAMSQNIDDANEKKVTNSVWREAMKQYLAEKVSGDKKKEAANG